MSGQSRQKRAKIKEDILTKLPMRNNLTTAAGPLVGKLVKTARENAGLTLEQLSMAIGSSNRQYTDLIERGQWSGKGPATPTLITLYMIAAACDVDVSELIPPSKDVLKAAGIRLKKVQALSMVK